MSHLTEDEIDSIDKDGVKFSGELAILAAKYIKKYDSDIQREVWDHLQECCNLYSVYISNRIEEELMK